MIQIISSSIESQNIQSDGRIYVTEHHVDSDGGAYTLEYAALPGTDLTAHLATAASDLEKRLQESAMQGEIYNNVQSVIAKGSLATTTFKYSSIAENAQSLIASYAESSGLTLINIGDYLNSQSDAFLLEGLSGTNYTQYQIDSFRAVWAQNAITALAVRNGQVA